MQISNNGDLLISINGKTKLLSKEEIVKLYNQNIAITLEDKALLPKKQTNILKEKNNKYYVDVDFSKDYFNFISHTTENQSNSEISKDTIVEEIRAKFLERSKKGQDKYGTNLDRNDLSLEEWLNHAIEEQMDSILYLTKIKKELSNKKNYGL